MQWKSAIMEINFSVMAFLSQNARKKVRALKIKKVDDKPMVIHTKEKVKIHTHNPKQAKIKGSNIYTVERGPKTNKASVEKAKATDAKNRNVNATEGRGDYRENRCNNTEEGQTKIVKIYKNTREHIINGGMLPYIK